jgi:glycosyltransferase involved in cell wall biosynthesis
VETRVYYLASELARRHEVVVYTRRSDERTKERFNHEVFEVDYSKHRGIRGIDFVWKIRSDIAKRQFDVLNIEQLGIHTLLAKTDACRMSVVTVHGRDLFDAPFFLRSLYRRILRRDSVKVVCVSEFMKKALLERFHLPEEKVTVVPHGVDLEVFKPVGPKRRNHFLFVGRFVPDKDPLCCLRAFKILKEKYPPCGASLTMIGAGPQFEAVEELVRSYDLASDVKLAGGISNLELPSYYSEASATVCPRLAGMVLLESLACGTPVIAGDINMAPEIITDECGFLVPPSDPVAFAEVMYDVCSSKDEGELKRMSLSARTRAEKYAWPIIAQKLEITLAAGRSLSSF